MFNPYQSLHSLDEHCPFPRKKDVRGYRLSHESRLRRNAKHRKIIGKRYGYLTIVAHWRDSHWTCRCDCGLLSEQRLIHLRRNRLTSCGCRRRLPRKDLSGHRFGLLVADHVVNRDVGRGQKRWFARCDCGNSGIFAAKALVSGNTRSCGCLRQAQSRINAHYTTRATSGRFLGAL